MKSSKSKSKLRKEISLNQNRKNQNASNMLVTTRENFHLNTDLQQIDGGSDASDQTQEPQIKQSKLDDIAELTK